MINFFFIIKKKVFINITPLTTNIKESFLVKIDGNSIAQVTKTMILGLNINSSLKLNAHINELCNSFSSHCFALYLLRSIVSKHFLLSYYYANLIARMRNDIIFWRSGSTLNRLLKFQKIAVRSVLLTGVYFVRY